MSDTEPRDPAAVPTPAQWVDEFLAATRKQQEAIAGFVQDAARQEPVEAEVAQLRKAVATIFEAWHRLEDPDMSRAAHRAIDDALDSVWPSAEAARASLPAETVAAFYGQPSGGAESGEGDDRERGLYGKYRVERISDPTGKHADCGYFVLDPQHDPHAVTALRAYADACAAEYPALAADLRAWVGPAPVVSGGQADGEGERLRDDEREAIALAKHRTWHIACAGDCGGTLDDRISVDRELVPAVERIVAARLAARPVLSREAVADLLVQQSVRVQVPNVGTVTGFLRRESAVHLAAVLVGQEER